LQSHYIKKKDDKNSKADKEVKEEVQIKKEKGIFDDVPAEGSITSSIKNSNNSTNPWHLDKEEMNKRLKEIDPTLNITFEDDENDEVCRAKMYLLACVNIITEKYWLAAWQTR
jgi:regulation of enolase protein 1 (concanavalin A-like superfamily)